MKYVVFFAILLLSLDCFAYRHRLDDAGTARIAKHVQSIYEISEEHGIPLWVLSGIAYNESNGYDDVVGDAGYAFSLMQIRCSTDGRRFSWIPFLREKGVPLVNCRDLLNPHLNLHSAALIINYHRDRLGDWPRTIMAYHLGHSWYKQKKRARAYYRRVKYFGESLDMKLRAEYYVQVAFRGARKYLRDLFVEFG